MKHLFLLILFSSSISLIAQPSLVRQAERYYDSHLYEEARDAIDEAILDESLNRDAYTWYIYGMIYEHFSIDLRGTDEHFSKAILGYNKAMEYSKDSYKPHYTSSSARIEELWTLALNEGSDAYRIKDYEAARIQFNRATIARPQDSSGFIYLGFVCLELGDLDCTKHSLITAIDRGASNPAYYSLLIRIYEQEGNASKVIEWTNQALEEFPNNIELGRIAVNVLINSGEHSEAKLILESLINQEPNNPNLYFNLGVLNEELHNNREAVQAYETAISLDPNNFDAIYNLAVYHYNKAADISKEMSELSEDIELSEAEYDSRYKDLKDEAAVYLNNALPLMVKATEIHPNQASLWYTLYVIYNELGRSEDADAAFSKYEELKLD